MSYYGRNTDVSELLGKTASLVTSEYDEVRFTMEDGSSYVLYHSQSCCENVYVEDVCGDLDDLVGSPFLMAEEVSNEEDPGPKGEYADSYTWTFYKFATIKGYVTIRWYGTSNGYYSESVDFAKVD